jgi:hypothetical protein
MQLLGRALGAVAGTAGGLYIVLNQDLSHGEGHGGHGEHHDTPVKHEAAEEADEGAAEEAKEQMAEDVKEGGEEQTQEGGEKEDEKEDKAKPEAATQEQSDSKPSDSDKVRCASDAPLCYSGAN